MIKKLLALTFMITSTIFANIDATIPVIDMEEYRNPETREKFIGELYDALSDVGFLAVVNTGVDQEILDNAYAAIEKFFAQPFEEKMESLDPEKAGERGYTSGESAKGHSEKDFKEFYSIGRELSPEDQERLGIWKNVWPENGDFESSLTSLYQTLEDYKEQFEQAIACAIGVEENFFAKMTSEGDILLRAIHYPANPPKKQFWAAKHTDIGLFTILPRATAEGLQVKNDEGEWIDVKVPADAFIINAGDMLENITNGEFHSGIHRVKANRDEYERYSVVFFVHPRNEDPVSPLPGCIERTGGVQKYANATRLELFEERLVDLGLAPYWMKKHLAESGLMERLIDLGRASPEAMQGLKDAGLASEKVLQELERIAPKQECIFDATIPVLDMEEYFNPETKDKFLKELYGACKEVGFFAVVNTGVSKEILDAGYDAVAEFFSLPIAEKMKVCDPTNNGQRGYVLSESAKGQSLQDFKEFYMVGRDLPAHELEELQLWENIWPEGGNLEEVMLGVYSALDGHKILLEKAFAEILDVSLDFFTNMTEKGDCSLRPIHYFQNPAEGQFWAAEHTDIVLFTILPRSTAAGLQVKNKEGKWIDVKVPEDAFIVNVGDMLENITNGEFHSGLHRVIAKGNDYERYSMVYFIHPRSEDRLDPLPQCIERTGGIRKYANATRLELLEERLVDLGNASYPMICHLAESGLMERLIEVKRASPEAVRKLSELGLASPIVLKELERINSKPIRLVEE